jgi:hypothetical protein
MKTSFRAAWKKKHGAERFNRRVIFLRVFAPVR